MLNQYLHDESLYLTDPCSNAKLILTDFSVSVSFPINLTVTNIWLMLLLN